LLLLSVLLSVSPALPVPSAGSTSVSPAVSRSCRDQP
jgi:hypothetical protein